MVKWTFSGPGDQRFRCVGSPCPGSEFADAAAGQRLIWRPSRICNHDTVTGAVGPRQEVEERLDEVASKADVCAHNPVDAIQHFRIDTVEGTDLCVDLDFVELCVILGDR